MKWATRASRGVCGAGITRSGSIQMTMCTEDTEESFTEGTSCKTVTAQTEGCGIKWKTTTGKTFLDVLLSQTFFVVLKSSLGQVKGKK